MEYYMKKFAILFLAAALQGSIALAQQAQPAPMMQQPATATQASPFDSGLAHLQQQWAIIKYQTPEEEDQEKAIEALANEAASFVAQNPGRAEPLIWQGIILATKAGIDGGVGALDTATAARTSLESAEKIDPNSLNGSVYTSLGSLYYKVPGWPLGFGDNDKAKAFLEKALALNPDGIDPNFFYGELMYEEGEYLKAQSYLQHALQAPARPGRELADKGRVEEINDLLAKVQKKLKS